jgi:hypothetical protein
VNDAALGATIDGVRTAVDEALAALTHFAARQPA